MRCPQCDARVPPQAEFCPECRTPISRGLREGLSSSGPRTRSDEELKRNRRNVLVLGAVFAFGLLIGGQSNWFNMGFDFDEADSIVGSGRPAMVEAQQFFEAYRDDPEAADERYDDRFMIVTGEFTEVRNDDQGNPDLRLRTSDPAAPLGVDLVGSSHDEAGRLRAGQIVTVGCEGVAQTGEERWLRDCTIELVRDGEAAPSGESEPAAGAPPAATAETPAAADAVGPSEPE